MNNLIIKPTWTIVLKIWWSYAWRFHLYTILIALIYAVAANYMIGIFNIKYTATMGTIAAYVIGILISIWCINIILTKKFKRYQLLIESNQ